MSLHILYQWVAASHCWPSLNVYRLSNVRVCSFLRHCSFGISVLLHTTVDPVLMCHGIGCPAGGCVLSVSLQILYEYIAASYCWPSLNVSWYRLSHLRVHSFLCHCSFRITVLSHCRSHASCMGRVQNVHDQCITSVSVRCYFLSLAPVVGNCGCRN